MRVSLLVRIMAGATLGHAMIVVSIMTCDGNARRCEIPPVFKRAPVKTSSGGWVITFP
jgi:hypothetical protein